MATLPPMADADAAEQPSDSRPTRWRSPFDPSMGDEEVDKLLQLRPFSQFSERRFPSNLPLRGILANDTRIRSFDKGQFIVREGDYGNSAFFILQGRARVILDSLPQDMLGRSQNAKRGVLKSIARAFRRAPYPETRPFSGRRNIQQQSGAAIFLQDVPRVLDGSRTAVIEEGELFGEIAALGRLPRVATIIAEDDCTVLLEIRWQGLRDFGRFAPEWYQHIEQKYRQHGLTSHLRATPLIDRLENEVQEQIAGQTKFLRFGGFDWHREFKQRDKDSSPGERLKGEPVVHNQGDYLNGLYLVLSGFVRVSEKYNYGERTISYLVHLGGSSYDFPGWYFHLKGLAMVRL
jgi:CRP-like cAMP-binding protein